MQSNYRILEMYFLYDGCIPSFYLFLIDRVLVDISREYVAVRSLNVICDH